MGLYAALNKLEPREQTYLLYRFGFTDGIEHTLTGAAIHFHLSENRTKLLEDRSLDTFGRDDVRTGIVAARQDRGLLYTSASFPASQILLLKNPAFVP